MLGMVLSTGTPLYLAVARGLETYLLHPLLFLAESLPFLLAGCLWLPYRERPRTSVGQGLAVALLVAAALIHVSMLTGLVSVGGDMVALTFTLIGAGMSLVVIVVTVFAQGCLYIRRHQQER